MNTNRWLAAVVVLQSIMLLTLWVGGPALPQAAAQIPDAGAQRLAMIEELRGANARLDKVITLLNSGELQVRVTTSDDPNGGR